MDAKFYYTEYEGKLIGFNFYICAWKNWIILLKFQSSADFNTYLTRHQRAYNLDTFIKHTTETCNFCSPQRLKYMRFRSWYSTGHQVIFTSHYTESIIKFCKYVCLIMQKWRYFCDTTVKLHTLHLHYFYNVHI